MPSTLDNRFPPNRWWSSAAFTVLLLLGLACGPLQTAAQTQQASAFEQDEPTASNQPLSLTEHVVRDVLQPLQRGMEERSLPQVLGVFDSQETPDYARLRDQLRSFFSRYEAVRFRYKVLQVTSEQDRAFAIAEVNIDATPADETQLAAQRSTQMHFEMKLGDKGWRLLGFKPADFFAQ